MPPIICFPMLLELNTPLGASMIGWTHKEHHVLNFLEKARLKTDFPKCSKIFCTLVYITKLNTFKIFEWFMFIKI
jgi:hypothetical protein